MEPDLNGATEPAEGPPLAGRIHLAMRAFVAGAGRRRLLPTVVHVGDPAGQAASLPDRDWYDAGIRADLVTRALDGVEQTDPLAWLSRSGELDARASDRAWCAAVIAGFARHDLTLSGFFLVTRAGWSDLTTGERHEWRRVRPARYVEGAPSAGVIRR